MVTLPSGAKHPAELPKPQPRSCPCQVAGQRRRAEITLGVLETQLSSVRPSAWGPEGGGGNSRSPGGELNSAANHASQAEQLDVAAVIATASALATEQSGNRQSACDDGVQGSVHEANGAAV